jgi:undecaprenyl pyrophosphate phosphatase UppP
MVIAERLYVNGSSISFPDALTAGVGHAFVLIPEVSRIGITITAGTPRWDYGNQRRRTFLLLSIPIILGMFLYELRDVQFRGGHLDIYPADLFSSFLFGVVSL